MLKKLVLLAVIAFGFVSTPQVTTAHSPIPDCLPCPNGR
jgi:hypothetical protein